VGRIFVGEKVDLIDLVNGMTNPRDYLISLAGRRRAILYALLQRYCFENLMAAGALGDLRIMIVVEQMEAGCRPATLILAETILGLDRRAGDRRVPYGGSPRLLLIWLMERLELLEPPACLEFYNAHSYCQRRRKLLIEKRRPCNYFKDLIADSPVRWFVPWWGSRR